MEELLISDNQLINIAEKELVEQTRASVKVFSDALVKSKAYYNLLASGAVEAFLREKGLLQGEYVSLHSSMKLLGDFEIADIQLPNLTIDVRAIFDENELFIPKKHFENKILPDIYLFVKMDDDLQNATMLGFVKPSSVNLKNQNDEYYFVNSSLLSPISELVSFIKSFPVKNQYIISENVEETLEKLIMLYFDNDIEPSKLEKLLDYLQNSTVAREKLVEFENFERLSSMAIQEFKDLDVKNNDISKYIKALVTTDEFLQFGGDGLNEFEETPTSAGLFIDDEEISDLKNGEVEESEVVVDKNSSEVFENSEHSEEMFEEVTDEVIDEQEVGSANLSLLDDDEVEQDSLQVSEIPVVDEFDVFDEVDEFETSGLEEEASVDSSELIENSVINEQDTIESVVEPLQEEDLEFQVDALDGVENDLLLVENAELDENLTVEEDIQSVVELEQLDTIEETKSEENENEIENIETVQQVESLDELNLEQVTFEDEEIELEFVENVDVETPVQDTETQEVTIDIDENKEIDSDSLVQEQDLEVFVDSEQIEIFDDISMEEDLEKDVVEEISEVSIDEDENLGIELDIPMTEENSGFEIPDVVAESVEDVDLSGVVTDEISFEEERLDDIVDVVSPSMEENFVSVSDEDVDNAIAQVGFIDDDDEQLVTNVNEEFSGDSGDFTLDELLSMGEDLSEGSATSEEDNMDTSSVNAGVSEIFDNETSETEQQAEDAETGSSDFAFALDNKSPIPKKLLVPIAAFVTVVCLIGAGAWYFLSQNKSVSSNIDIVDNSNFEDMSMDLNDIVPDESVVKTDIPVSDNIKSNENKKENVANEPQVPQQLPKEDVKPIPEQLSMQKIKKDFSQPNTYLSVSKIVWDVPEYLTYNDDFSSYLQALGSSVKLNLSSDLLLIAENTLFNKVKVKIQLKDSGRKFSAELTDSCGSKVVDDLVLQSVKNTLNLMQPPVNSLDTADEDLFLTIYL